MSQLRSIVKSLLPRSLRNAVRFAMWSKVDKAYAKETGNSDFPPAYLRVRVHGSLDIPSFFAAGQRCADDLIAAIQSVGLDPLQFSDILDFGCGSARTLKAMRSYIPSANYYGCDTDPDAIKWDQQSLNFGSYYANSPEPPLMYEDQQFDLIYAISVFTHIDERMQSLWLKELHRVAKPNALLLLTVHGPDVPTAQNLPDIQKSQYRRDGFLFIRDRVWSDLFPDFYQTTYHTRDYIERVWSQHFEILAYRDKGMDGLQDVVILRRRDE